MSWDGGRSERLEALNMKEILFRCVFLVNKILPVGIFTKKR